MIFPLFLVFFLATSSSFAMESGLVACTLETSYGSTDSTSYSSRTDSTHPAIRIATCCVLCSIVAGGSAAIFAGAGLWMHLKSN